MYFFINFDAGATLRYGLFRQVNCFRPSCSARQERNHSEKVSEREWRRVCISRSRCFSGRNFPRLFRGSSVAITVVRGHCNGYSGGFYKTR